MYRKILIPLDGSDRSQAILTHLSPLLRAADAELTLLGVIEELEALGQNRGDLVAAAQRRASDYLDAVTGSLADLGLDATPMIRRGSPAASILEVARELEIDLIAMASHGYGGLSRVFYGSTTERVLRGSTGAVLVVKSYTASDQPGDPLEPIPHEPVAFHDVLVPLDGSQSAEAVLSDAVAVARDDHATLHLVQVVPRRPMGGWYLHDEELDYEPILEREYLRGVAERLEGERVRCKTAVLQGVVPEVLRAYAEESGADLMAMTTHGRTGWSRWVLGSVAEDLLRSVHTPILLRRIRRQKGA